MNHPRIPTPILDHARTILEPLQFEAWVLYELGQTFHPIRGVRWVGDQLDIDPSSVNGRLRRAGRRLRNAGILQDASGYWYHNAPARAQEARRREDTPGEGDDKDATVETRGNAYEDDAVGTLEDEKANYAPLCDLINDALTRKDAA